jgi:aquaporin Z
VVAQRISTAPAYVVGPLAGALIAVGFAWILRGPGGDPGDLAAARGMLDPAAADAKLSSGPEQRPPA